MRIGAPQLALLLSLAAPAAGCLGSYERPADGGQTMQPDAGSPLSDGPAAYQGREQFESDILPMLMARCNACHGKEGSVGPAFMKPVAYESVTAWPGLIMSDAMQSRLITKGPHNGAQWFNGGEMAKLVAWLGTEAAHLPPPMGNSASTIPQKPAAGANTVALDSLGADFVGSTITFDASFINSTLRLTNITVHADGPTGIHIVHPLFTVWTNGVKNPDPVDSFSNLDQSIARGNDTPLGPGTLLLNNVGALDLLSIAFTSITKYDSGGGGGMDGGVQTGGCKAPGSFTTNATPTLAARCVGCHGGANGQATAALDMTKISDMTQMGQAAACGQVKNKIDTANPANSPILAVTKPGSVAQHPYKFGGDQNAWNTYMQAATQWITQEK